MGQFEPISGLNRHLSSGVATEKKCFARECCFLLFQLALCKLSILLHQFSEDVRKEYFIVNNSGFTMLK